MTVDPRPSRSLVTKRAVRELVRTAVLSVYGVSGFTGGGPAGRLLERLGLAQPGLHVEIGTELTVDLRLTVAYGLPIAEVARQVEASVRYALRHALEREPERVSIRIGGMRHEHGIAPEMVEHEPRFAARLPEILAFVGDLPVVAHNAGFDVGVIRDACDASGLPWPDLRYACSLVFARATYDLLSYSLPWAAEAAGFPLDDHHQPEADAVASARIMLDIAARRGADDWPALLRDIHAVFGRVSPEGWTGSHRLWSGDRVLLFSPNPDADPEHPFYGRELVFTGALSAMTRTQAWNLVAACGATPAAGVTKRTSILIVGFQDARKLRPGATLSAKAQKAADLRAKGQTIEVMPEDDFFQSLGEAVGPGLAVRTAAHARESRAPTPSPMLEISISINAVGEV